MSQSLLYQIFGIKGVTYRSTSFSGNAVVFKAETKSRHAQCISCGDKNAIFKGQKLSFGIRNQKIDPFRSIKIFT